MSGGQKGSFFASELSQLLNPFQVIDLKDTPDPIAGGDGTIEWILNSIEKALNKCQQTTMINANNDHLVKSIPPPAVAILPIGTGNDLANELGWLSAYHNHSLSKVLQKILTAQTVFLDRWCLQSTTSTTTTNTNSSINQFQNYLGIGVDAEIVLQFHRLRKSSPSMFFHSYLNKFWYGVMGWNEIWSQWTCQKRSFSDDIILICDNVKVELPTNCQGIVFLNISKYGGGSELWSNHNNDNENDDENNDHDIGKWMESSDEQEENNIIRKEVRSWETPSYDDGILEVVAVRSSLELAQIKLGICSCQKIAQGKVFELTQRSSWPIQLDGEPYVQLSGVYKISANSQQAVMLKPVPDDLDLNLVEVLTWATEQNIMTNAQQHLILQEYIKRVETSKQKPISW